MEGISVKCFSNSGHPGSNEKKYEFHSYKTNDNEQDACESHAHIFHLLIFSLNQDY